LRETSAFGQSGGQSCSAPSGRASVHGNIAAPQRLSTHRACLRQSTARRFMAESPWATLSRIKGLLSSAHETACALWQPSPAVPFALLPFDLIGRGRLFRAAGNHREIASRVMRVPRWKLPLSCPARARYHTSGVAFRDDGDGNPFTRHVLCSTQANRAIFSGPTAGMAVCASCSKFEERGSAERIARCDQQQPMREAEIDRVRASGRRAQSQRLGADNAGRLPRVALGRSRSGRGGARTSEPGRLAICAVRPAALWTLGGLVPRLAAFAITLFFRTLTRRRKLARELARRRTQLGMGRRIRWTETDAPGRGYLPWPMILRRQPFTRSRAAGNTPMAARHGPWVAQWRIKAPYAGGAADLLSVFQIARSARARGPLETFFARSAIAAGRSGRPRPTPIGSPWLRAGPLGFVSRLVRSLSITPHVSPSLLFATWRPQGRGAAKSRPSSPRVSS